MPNGGHVFRTAIRSVRIAQLENLAPHPAASDPWGFYVPLRLHVFAGDPPASRPFTFRVDTGTQVSVLPDSFLAQDRTALGPLSRLLTLNTVGGANTGLGRMAAGVRVRFPGLPRDYQFDLLISSTLTTPYGLLSLRDLHRHFHLNTSGILLFGATGEPLHLGYLELRPR